MPNINDINNILFTQQGAFLPGTKFVSAFVSNAGSGNVDLYTCPSGKRAMVNLVTVFNTAGTSTNVYPAIYVSGTYYKFGSTLANGSNAIGTIVSSIRSIILEAGERLAINTSQAGINVWPNIVEFDNTVGIKTAKVLNPSSGNNTLYTCPSGKNAYFLDTRFLANNSAAKFQYFNNSGGAAVTAWYSVPFGGSAGSSNVIGTEASLSSGSNQLRLFGSCVLTPGDFIVFNTSTGTAGQIAWANVWEV
jgi:hypothetical protein